ncbi:hypothetical protein NVP1261O_36 [Vibrio phage 1.261.O._10N.286.51.A7]|uniref:Uncharacterized protein n=1 Tax=Vibrio phage 1.261.O._10N.286.51.A7 TaxID=1881237 RepID=A0A2I7RZH0_9CAUD|nr:hypothetical protein HOU80_gp66 [Vibrio phage 1.261.O._10N.286.51.A7]AUR99040.1 hypothetical protein NVP1261O_36 [Vibrio phage 1.261.O._10N.286.51.A7]
MEFVDYNWTLTQYTTDEWTNLAEGHAVIRDIALVNTHATDPLNVAMRLIEDGVPNKRVIDAIAVEAGNPLMLTIESLNIKKGQTLQVKADAQNAEFLVSGTWIDGVEPTLPTGDIQITFRPAGDSEEAGGAVTQRGFNDTRQGTLIGANQQGIFAFITDSTTQTALLEFDGGKTQGDIAYVEVNGKVHQFVWDASAKANRNKTVTIDPTHGWDGASEWWGVEPFFAYAGKIIDPMNTGLYVFYVLRETYGTERHLIELLFNGAQPFDGACKIQFEGDETEYSIPLASNDNDRKRMYQLWTEGSSDAWNGIKDLFASGTPIKATFMADGHTHLGAYVNTSNFTEINSHLETEDGNMVTISLYT